MVGNNVPHDVYIAINNNPVGELLDLIPRGLYTFSIDPEFLNESLFGPQRQLY